MQALGGSGTTEEIYEKVSEIMGLSSSILEVPHGKTSQGEVEYRLAWSRTYLRKYGLLENSARGVWSLTTTGFDVNNFDPRDVIRAVRDSSASSSTTAPQNGDTTTLPNVEGTESDEAVLAWHEQIHNILLAMDPSAFERLAQRLLRESGFIQVEVTGKSGDGGIDGIGIARINGFLSFQVLFQCKRYQSAITSAQIRDFRGAMQGRTDKGLFITTSTFTRDAVKEATRDGAPPIDLIDGEQLVQRLKELGLGVKIKMVETVDVDPEWFAKL